MLDFTLPREREAHEPPEARGLRRDNVRLLVSEGGSVTHHSFANLPDLLHQGDLVVVNTSPTLPAAVRLDRLAVHFSSPFPSEDAHTWLVELRRRTGNATTPYSGGCPGEWFPLPGGATLTLLRRHTGRLWIASLDTAVEPYLYRRGVPIRYDYVGRDWPLEAYQTVFASPGGGGSAEMPSAARPFTPELVTRLVSRGVTLAPISLHTGVASPEKDEPPYPERFEVPPATADLVNATRARGGRVIAVGTTVVRALETAADPDLGLIGTGSGSPGSALGTETERMSSTVLLDAARPGPVRPAAGWTDHVITPERGVRAVDGLLTGLHEPRSSHLMMLTAIAGEDLLRRTYEAALDKGYLWHEFGDLNLLLPGGHRPKESVMTAKFR